MRKAAGVPQCYDLEAFLTLFSLRFSTSAPNQSAVLPLKPFTVADLIDDTSFDVVVVGAGGAGMACALFAAIEGARVLLIESTAWVGGSTALSPGTVWIPGTAEGLAANPSDSIDAARTYLDAAVGNRTPSTLREAFLTHGSRAVARLQSQSHVAFRARHTRPDHMLDLPGATTKGRSLEPLPFDGRLLGPDLALVRPPGEASTVLGGMMVDRHDLTHLRQAKHSLRALRRAASLLTSHALDRVRLGRGARLLRGNAMVGRLLLSLRERGVTLLTRARVISITRTARGVDELMLAQGNATRHIRALGGVVLATGGFNRNPMQRAARLPGIDMAWCPGAPGHTGTAHAYAESLGAVYGTGAISDCIWAPVSMHTQRDGSLAAVPHFDIDRAAPRMVAVDARGRRFANEAASHHVFAMDMQEAHRDAPTIPAYLITDADGLHKYGLGTVLPNGWGLKAALAQGSIVCAPTLRALAAKLDISAEPLSDSILRFNAGWADALGGGSPRATAADASSHHPAAQELDWHAQSAAAGPINKPPFYAVKLYPGDVSAATGFLTDSQARALDAQGRAIPGLYAIGNDMHAIMGGTLPAAGTSLGPALVFAYLSARSAVARSRGKSDDSASPSTPKSGPQVQDQPNAVSDESPRVAEALY